MDPGILCSGKKTVGLKESLKAVNKDLAQAVFIAKDAEARIVQGIIEACRDKDIPIYEVDDMQSLGKSCGIQVGTAVAAFLKED